MVPFSRCVVFFGIATIGCVLDLLTKSWAFQLLGWPPKKVCWLWEGYVGIETAVNPGALFGLGQGHGALFATISIAAIIGILYWLFVSGAASDLYLTVALGCVFAGILGNLYDRLGFSDQEGVRDWILFRYEAYTWPNFNIADSLLVCGAALLVFHGLRSSPGRQEDDTIKATPGT